MVGWQAKTVRELGRPVCSSAQYSDRAAPAETQPVAVLSCRPRQVPDVGDLLGRLVSLVPTAKVLGEILPMALAEERRALNGALLQRVLSVRRVLRAASADSSRVSDAVGAPFFVPFIG